MSFNSYGLQQAVISVLVIGGLILFIWSKISGKTIMQLIKELMENE